MPMHDLKIAARALRKSPGLVAVAVLSLGLGIGVNSTLFAVFRTVVLKGPTVGDPGRLVRIEPGNGNKISYANFRDLRPADAFNDLAAYTMTRFNRQSDAARPVVGMLISPRFFDVLHVQPVAGRTPAGDAEVVVARAFAASRPLNLGAALELSGRIYTVTGILAEDFRSIDGALGPDVYVPVSRQTAPAMDQRESGVSFTLLGRLRAGVSRQQAATAITAQFQELARLYRDVNEGMGRQALLFPVSGLGSWATRGAGVGQIAIISAVPFVLFGMLLLISCANVAGLLVARGAARTREIAIRLALGASRRQVVRGLLAESLWLGLLGSAAGVLLALWLCALISSVVLPQMPRAVDVRPDATLLLYALGAAVISAVVSGLTPALASTRVDLSGAMKKGEAGGHRFRLRNLLVVGQAALSVMLLFVSVLFLRSLAHITTLDPGFDMNRTVTAHLDVDKSYPKERYLQIAEQARLAAAAVPGVESATLASLIPLGGDSYSARYEVRGRKVSAPRTAYMSAGPDFFRTMGIPLRRGREFSTGDRGGAPSVAIVNEAFVRGYGLGDDAVGQFVRIADEPWAEIVAVAANHSYSFYGEEPQPIVYRPFLQQGGNLYVVARSARPPSGMLPDFARAVREPDRGIIVDAKLMREATSLERSLRQMGSLVLGVLGGLGLLLAAIGLYGVMAYRVQRRIPEMGIRMALGAPRTSVLRIVLLDGLRLIGSGVVLGMILSLAAARPLAFLMSGIPTFDPWTILATAGLLLTAGLAASWVPARRATHVDPMTALRCD